MARQKSKKSKIAKPNPKLAEVTEAVKDQLTEVWAFILLFLGIFIFISTRQSHSTGLVGYWLVQYFAKNIMGNGIYYLPWFFWAASASLFVTLRRHSRPVLIGLGIWFSAFVIYLEFKVNGPSAVLRFPIPTNGGGLLGSIGAYLLYKTMGIYGSLVFLGGLAMVSLVLMFNFSIRSILKGLWALSTYLLSGVQSASDGLHKTQNKTLSKDGFWKGLSKKMFYKKIEKEAGLKKMLPKVEKPISKEEIKQNNDDYLEKFFKDTEDSPKQVEIPKLKDESLAKTDSNEEIVLEEEEEQPYILPPLKLLEKPKQTSSQLKEKQKQAAENAKLLEMALESFNVAAKVVNITAGPAVTRYELQPGDGVKISKITNLSQDIALKLATADVRIEAPIPGKALIGIEVPNDKVDMVTMRSIIDHTNFMEREGALPVTIGQTISGDPIIMALEEMPHLLIAGATGSGKSVCVNSIIMSILLRSTPQEVKFLMIDPKKVELSLYDGIPHLLAPVVTNPNKAAATLKQWALLEMEKRYQVFSEVGVKHIIQYNEQADRKLPYIVVIIDELADLMMVASQDVEHTICRLAQMARATGIHLVVATQRPSVNVVTGLIKANIPSRISFFLQSQIDSRTILDEGGAEKLMGKGDMLYAPVGMGNKQRSQGVFVSEKEVKGVVEWVKKQQKPTYIHEIIDVQPIMESEEKKDTNEDPLFGDAKEIIQNTQYASTSYLQRKLRIGYNRAARLMDELEEAGVVSPATDGKRSVL